MRKVKAIIRRNAKTKQWHVLLRASNGEPLFDNYKRKIDAVKAARLLLTGVEIIVKPVKMKKP